MIHCSSPAHSPPTTAAADKSTFNDYWLYWLAPMCGAILATLFQVLMNRIDHVRVAFPAWLCQCLCFCGICREAEDGSGDGALPLMTLAVEFVGTFFFVLTAALSQEPFAIGAMLTSLVYALDHISADFNPAITVAMGVRRGALFSQRGKIISIVLAQMLGAFAAAFMAFFVAGEVSGGLLGVVPHGAARSPPSAHAPATGQLPVTQRRARVRGRRVF